MRPPSDSPDPFWGSVSGAPFFRRQNRGNPSGGPPDPVEGHRRGGWIRSPVAPPPRGNPPLPTGGRVGKAPPGGTWFPTVLSGRYGFFLFLHPHVSHMADLRGRMSHAILNLWGGPDPPLGPLRWAPGDLVGTRSAPRFNPGEHGPGVRARLPRSAGLLEGGRRYDVRGPADPEGKEGRDRSRRDRSSR